MKTQIITLESHDDLISVRDRLSWAKTPRILLVWPKGERISLRSLDLKVLQRHADSLGAQLGIVTRLDSVRRKAEALDMPVFESSAAAQRDVWPQQAPRHRRRISPPRRDLRALRDDAMPKEAAWRSSLVARVLVFAAGVLAVFALVAVFVPRAEITLHPESRVQQLMIPVTASPGIDSVFVTGSIPARVEKVVLSGSKTVNAWSRIAVPQTAARGAVRFRNLTQNEVTIPAGTVVFASANSPARFHTVNEARLPAGLDQTVEVPIEALQGGAAGNVEAGAIQAIEGPLGLMAAVDNTEPAGGGSDTTALGANENDRLRLRESLFDELKIQADEELRKRLSGGDFLLDGTLAVSETLEETFDPPVGKPGTTLSLSARIEFSAQVASTVDLRQLADAVLNAAAPEGFSPVENSLTFEQATPPETASDGTTSWQMQAGRRILRTVDPAVIVAATRGHSTQTAETALAKISDWESKPQITLSPSWWPMLPLIPFRISVVLQ